MEIESIKSTERAREGMMFCEGSRELRRGVERKKEKCVLKLER